MRAIFGDKAGDVKDASLKAPPGLKGTVIKTRLFSRKKRDNDSKKQEKIAFDKLDLEYKKKLQDHYIKSVSYTHLTLPTSDLV